MLGPSLTLSATALRPGTDPHALSDEAGAALADEAGRALDEG